MRTNDKYSRVRTGLIVLPLFMCFLLYILFKFLLPDYFITETKLETDTGVIQGVFKSKCPSYKRFKGKVYENCIDIILTGKPYFIRFTDRFTDNYWEAIADPANISKKIEVKFQPRLLHDNILNNPNQISIDNRVIIPYDSKNTVIGWFIVVVIIILAGGSYYTYRLYRIYKKNLYPYDRKLARKSRWKLFLVWFND